ncbi:MAG: serine/threonine-protein kinase, partial [Nakamurella sp.]
PGFGRRRSVEVLMTVPGAVLAGRYRLVDRIATGGMGSVWEAWDELLHRRVAVKQLLPQPGLSKDDAAMARSRVIREARITARLHHPHAVTLYDVIEQDGQPCLVLQYVPSQSLSSLLAEQGPLPVAFVARIGAEVASALAAAHLVGIIHRDVKPSNVLIASDGAAKLTDFGISHAAGDISLTSTGMVTGTPAFLAPEVARGAPSGFPADVFSLGATMYAALEGAPPFGTDQNPMATLHKVASGEVIPPRRSGPLTAVLLQMLAAEPAERPGMSDIARVLAGHADGSAQLRAAHPTTIALPPRTIRDWPTNVQPGAPPARPAPVPLLPASLPSAVRRRRSRGPLLAVAIALVLSVAAFGAFLLFGRTAGGHAAASASAQPSLGTTSTTASTTGSPTSRSQAPISTRAVLAPKTTAPRSGGRAVLPPAPAASSVSRTSTSKGQPRTTTTASRTAAPTPSTSTSTSTSTSKLTSSTSRSSPAAPPPTSAQLAGAITDYYALLPGDTDHAWAGLTSKYQTDTAKSRQYYQRFWDSVQRVVASRSHGATPDTAEATITYYFKSGKVAVEPTVYSLVRSDGVLKIDTSTVLSSEIR